MADGRHGGTEARKHDGRRRLAYCTNVHAGESLELTRRNLETHAVEVRRLLGASGPLGVGLWLSARAARELHDRGEITELGSWLAERDLTVFTINGFPYGDFHQPVVKYRVYEPTWCDERRLAYTLDLARILVTLLPDQGEGSISTLPVGWATRFTSRADRARAGVMLRRAADELASLEDSSGRLIHLDLEPEPGCLLQRSEDVVDFFTRHLLDGSEERTRRHLRICHDVCHAAVMFESQAEMFERYRAAGLTIGKVQVSSAVHAPFDELSPPGRAEALEELLAFREPRYLHQTVELTGEGPRLHEDLPMATTPWLDGPPPHACRVHFHVPIHIETLNRLRTTRAEIDICLDLLASHPETRHIEVETYAWDVLPAPLRVTRLAEGIAAELRWLRDRVPSGFFENQ